jgi:hypothetical protein
MQRNGSFMDTKSHIAPFLAGAIVMGVLVGVAAWRLQAGATKPDADRSAAPEAEATIVVDPAPSRALPTLTDPAAEAAALEAATKVAEAGEQKLRTRYQTEAIDANWAASKQQALEGLSVSPQIEQVKAQPLAMVANCRTTVCLIDADFPSRTAAEDWFTLYTLNAGGQMSQSSSRNSMNPDGTVHLQIYGLARQ